LKNVGDLPFYGAERSLLIDSAPSHADLVQCMAGATHRVGGTFGNPLKPERDGPTSLPTGRHLPAGWHVVRRQRSEGGMDCSTVRLMDASALSSDERVLSTMIFRNADPLTPVNPSCSEPLSVIK